MAAKQSSGDKRGLSHALTSWLARAPTGWFALYAVVCAFTTYFCMYSFRKPFAVGTYAGQTFLNTLALPVKLRAWRLFGSTYIIALPPPC